MKKQVDARLPGITDAASIAGPFVFSGAITPHDLSRRILVTSLSQLPAEASEVKTGNMMIDIEMDRAFAQSWTIYSNLTEILSRAGSSTNNLLRQRVFLRTMRDLPGVERIMDHFLPEAKPATTIVQVPEAGMDPDISVQMDFIALIPGKGLEREVISIPEMQTPKKRYPQATRSGQFIFISNINGVNPKTGKLASSLEELDYDAEKFSHIRLLTAKDEAILTQAWFIFKNISLILESQRASLTDIIKVNGWLGINMREFDPVLAVRASFFNTRDSMPASASIGISALDIDGALLGYDCVALAPGGEYRKELKSETAALVPVYVLAARGGPFVFTCGEVPIDPTVPKVVTAFNDLDDEGRLLSYGRLNREAPYEARAWFVYKKHADYLKEHGASYSDVVHQTVFICDPAAYVTVERIGSLFFGSRVPPTTVIPITDTSPFREAKLEIEMIAATGV